MAQGSETRRPMPFR